MKALFGATLILAALAGSTTMAAAQGMSTRGYWDGRRAPPPDDAWEYQPRGYGGYRRDAQFEEDLRWEQRRRARAQRYDRYYDDYPPEADEAAIERERTRPVRPRPLGSRRIEVMPDDEPEERPQARQPAPSGQDQEEIVHEGGARPDIAPKAPPVVAFRGGQAPGSIVIDTGARKLYFVLSGGKAYQYPIGVGRDGFSWSGSEKVSRIGDWPDWYPPAEMRERKPELPTKMTGGINNPLGAKAIYLGNTLYRIHGTNDPKSIGRAESSGCFRMMNAHVVHLASLVQVGAEVTVMQGAGVASAANAKDVR